LGVADPKEKDYSAFADELLKYAEQPFAPAKPKPQPSGPLTRGARAAATPPAAEKPATSLPADLEKIKQLTEQLEKLKAEHAKALEAKDARQKELEAKVNDLTAANTEAKERLVASIADKDNLVKIGRRDVENAREFGVKGLVVKLFDVVDTLNICLANLPESAVGSCFS
jgi:molecular chaperone GrpE (heat shock protein)